MGQNIYLVHNVYRSGHTDATPWLGPGVRSNSPSLIATYGQYYGVGETGLVCYIFEMAKSDLKKETSNDTFECLEFKIYIEFNYHVKWNRQ